MGAKKDKPRTVARELFEAWQTLKRRGDAGRICEKTGFSRPPIDDALNYGHVNTPEIVDGINKFFADRQKEETNTAKKLLQKTEHGTAAATTPTTAGE